MKCCECSSCSKGWFEGQPDSYVCIGVPEPFVISDVNAECTEYPEEKTGNVKHKYLRELFPDGNLPFPYSEEDYHDFDTRDTFSMNDTLVVWLYECLRYFQDEASKIVDFTFHKFIINGDELTHKQCIDRMVKDCKIILLYNDNMFDDFKKDDEYIENVVNPAKNDLFKILSKVYWNMWW